MSELLFKVANQIMDKTDEKFEKLEKRVTALEEAYRCLSAYIEHNKGVSNR